MIIEERNVMIKNYILETKEYFDSIGYSIFNDTIQNVYDSYIQSNKSFEEIKRDIDGFVKQRLQQFKQEIELSNQMYHQKRNNR